MLFSGAKAGCVEIFVKQRQDSAKNWHGRDKLSVLSEISEI